MELAKLLGYNMRRLRLERGMSQATLAELLQISDITVYNYEAALRWPKAETITAIAKIFGVRVTDLLAEEGEAGGPTLEQAFELVGSYLGFDVRKRG